MAKKRITNSLRGALNRKPKPATLPKAPWDHGATGPANRLGLLEEPAADIDPETGRGTKNPNRVTRMRRRPWVDTYERQGKLTKDQANIARELRDAAEGARNQDPLAALGSKIDRDMGLPDPQAAAYDARRKFHRMWAHVPKSDAFIIDWVVLGDNPIMSIPGCRGSGPAFERHMSRLCAGLDVLRNSWSEKS